MKKVKRIFRSFLNRCGYEVTRIRVNDESPKCSALPIPSPEIVKMASKYFSNSFSISPQLDMAPEEIESKIKSYFWHYPFKFDGRFVDSNHHPGKGLKGRHYQRYFHIFPAILSMTNGSLSGKNILDIGCNCGFMSIQARLAGANLVLGVDASPKNVEQGKFILKLTGLEGIEYKVMDVYDVSKEALGEFDITFFFGLLYHLDKPIFALEQLYEVTKSFAVVDTQLTMSNQPVLKLHKDRVHEQNYSNKLAFHPSESAVPLMLRQAGFSDIFLVQNRNNDLPWDYLTGNRKTFIATK